MGEVIRNAETGEEFVLEHVVDVAGHSAVDQDFEGTQPVSIVNQEADQQKRQRLALARLKIRAHATKDPELAAVITDLLIFLGVEH